MSASRSSAVRVGDLTSLMFQFRSILFQCVCGDARQIVQVVQRQEVRLHVDGSLSRRRAVDNTARQVGSLQQLHTTLQCTLRRHC